MKKILLISISILILLLVYCFIDYNLYMDVEIVNNTSEINTYHKVKEYIGDTTNVRLLNGDEEIFFNKIGKNNVHIKLINKFGKIYNDNILVNVIDNEKPVVECKNFSSAVSEEIDFIEEFNVSDNSNGKLTAKIVGNYNINKIGKYKLTYSVSDLSGNISECDFTLNIKSKIDMVSSDFYYLKLNKSQNVLMIYAKNNDGKYTNLVKTFVTSAGNATPLGIYKIKERHTYISFSGGSWGRYGVRITGPYWFHSVPYNSKPTKKNPYWNNISYKEYNKLGNLASHGCIRLQVSDVKWLYDNVPKGTIVEIYESKTLPEGVIKPTPHTIDVKSAYRGWDPTDMDKNNPWNN